MKSRRLMSDMGFSSTGRSSARLACQVTAGRSNREIASREMEVRNESSIGFPQSFSARRGRHEGPARVRAQLRFRSFAFGARQAASIQINGCAHCIDMHTKELRADGESEQRLYLLNAWRESPFYSDRERAALAWTEAVTLVADTQVPDEVYEEARKQFTEEELVNLTLALVAINGANRLNIAFRTVPGSYQVRREAAE